MSDLEKTIQIIFEAIDSFSAPLAEMVDALSEFGDSAASVTGQTETLDEAIEEIPAQITLDVEIAGDYKEDLLAIEDALTDTECVQLDLDAGMALEDIELLWDKVDEIPDEVEIDFDLDDSEIDKLQEEIEALEAKKRALDAGEAIIRIDSTGLEPALEMIMWQILQKIQLKANEQATNFLLGIN